MRHTKRLKFSLLMVWGVLLTGSSLFAQEERATRDHLTSESFADLHKLMQPRAGEYRWDEIPWVASVWHARKQAAAENKPIFIFGTAGAGFNDPLGNC